MLLRVLLAVHPGRLRRRLLRLIDRPNVVASEASPRANFWVEILRKTFDAVIVSRDLLRDPIAEQLSAIRALPERPEVLVISSREDPQDRAALLSAGCLAVLNEDLPDPVLSETLEALLGRLRSGVLTRLGFAAGEESCRLSDFASASPAMQRFLALVRRVVASDSSLLIQGETGVGKERLARAIHAEGARSRGPFVAVNCAAVPETLLESELFGHEEGAFTGAVRAHRGYFEIAHGGTVFLDEVGEIPLHVQAKLLRVLQERAIQRLGSEQTVRVDVRVMAATNRDLAAEMRAGRFRADLYYRLSVVTLTIPPLRERREDIPALLDSYLEYFRGRLRRPVERFSEDARRALVAYGWPGNVRELVNVVERAVLLSAGSDITLGDLPEAVRGEGAEVSRRAPLEVSALGGDLFGSPIRVARRLVVEKFEREYLRALLQATGGRVGEAARRAGVNPRSFFDLLRKHGIRKEEFRERLARVIRT